MVHCFRFDPRAVYCDPAGQKQGERFGLGDWECVQCRVKAGFWLKFGRCCGTQDCPGLVLPAQGELTVVQEP